MAISRCWNAGLVARARGAGRARHLAADRAASGAPDALRDPRPFRRASALAAAVGLLLYDRLASRTRPAGIGDHRHHASSGRQRAEAADSAPRSNIPTASSTIPGWWCSMPSMPRSGAPTIRTGARCVRADRLDIWRLAVIDRGHRHVITARALANATGAWTASVAETVLRMPPPRRRHGPDQPDHRPASVRYRQRLCLPEQRPAADLRQPL